MFRKLLPLLSLIPLLLTGSCNISVFDGNSGETISVQSQSQPPKPTDFEEQPEYKLGLKEIGSDSDGDGFCDYADLKPDDPSFALPAPFVESEFNNNISDANRLSSELPLVIVGALSEGSNYYMDTDYFGLNLKKGERVSVVLYKGSLDDSGISLDRDASGTPNISVLSSNGATLTTVTTNTVISTVTSFVVPEDGVYYVEVSAPDITSAGYNYPYVLSVFVDQDFDGVPDSIERFLGLKTDSQDSDGDMISDFDELYEFAYELGKIPFKCSQNKSFALNYWDRDGDGIPNWYDVDSDADGPPDRVEGTSDSDGDFVPDFVDLDSDDDGLKDGEEVGVSFQKSLDSDGDGIPDFKDTDSDNDGIPNSLDPEPQKPQEPDDVGSEDSLILYSGYGDLNGKALPGIGLVGYDLVLNSRNASNDVVVIFPTPSGTKAVKPESVDGEDAKTVRVKVPHGVKLGEVNIYLYDPKTRHLSNSLGIKLLNPKRDIVITSVTSPVEVGAGGVVEGINLSKGNVSVIFTDGVKTVQAQGSSDGSKVQFTVPADAVSGYVKVQVGSKESNLLPVKVVRTVNVTLSPGFNLDFSKVTVSSDVEELPLSSSGEASLKVEAGRIAFISSMLEDDFDGDGSKDYALIYEAVVLPGQTSVVLNAQSTAVKWVFYTTGLYRSLPPSKWQEALDYIGALDEVKRLAQRIDQVLAQNPQAISSWSDEQIKELYREAVKAALEALSSKAAQPEIRPSDEQYDISLSPKDPADLALANDTKLYLSVSVVAKDGTVLRSHISSPWDEDIVEPDKGQLLAVNGRDCEVKVITPGSLPPQAEDKRVYGYVHLRTWFDGIIAPIASDFVLEPILGLDPDSKQITGIFLEFVGPKAISSYIEEVVNSSTPPSQIISLRFLLPLKIAINSCTEIPPGATCQKLISIVAKFFGLTPQDLAKRVTSEAAKKVLAKFVPVVGQLEIVLDAVGKINSALGIYVTWSDLRSVPQQVNFDVDFPLEVTEVKPSCVNKNVVKDYFTVVVHGKGFTPYVKGHLWWKEEVYPEVFLGGVEGKVLYVSKDGTLLHAKFPINSFSDGDYSVEVKHQGQEASSEETIKITGEQTIFISQIDPSSGVPGDKVSIYGCGFSPNLNETKVFFSSKEGEVEGTIVHINPARIDVIVPDGAETGPVYVESNGVKSNSLDFKVEKVAFQIVFGDCGTANDDTFALYVDGKLIYSMPSPSRPFPVDVEIPPGIHEVMLVGITAPDNIGTYCISFPSNVEVLSGPPLEGRDLTAGVVKKWLIKVEATKSLSLPSYVDVVPELAE